MNASSLRTWSFSRRTEVVIRRDEDSHQIGLVLSWRTRHGGEHLRTDAARFPEAEADPALETLLEASGLSWPIDR